MFTWISLKRAFWCNFVYLFIHAQKSGRELNPVFVCKKLSPTISVCYARLVPSGSAVSSPDTWDWTRTACIAVMHRWTCGNSDKCQNKVPSYASDIDILHVASMHRIVRHRIDPYRWIVTPYYWFDCTYTSHESETETEQWLHYLLLYRWNWTRLINLNINTDMSCL